ncbi:hypothetical protein DPMN_068779 [Dreissena polymorpha]|uniref:Uncharacterized protein n=1 Tax=Dreissena polymorpha TaxID=45954 RepID=A0A9D3Z2V7_DREPO|nr:hypothetical protein DPMN_068779 [Dreissena polymorpha]
MRSKSSANLKLRIGIKPKEIDVVVMESIVYCLLKEEVEQDGREQTCLTDAH